MDVFEKYLGDEYTIHTVQEEHMATGDLHKHVLEVASCKIL